MGAQRGAEPLCGCAADSRSLKVTTEATLPAVPGQASAPDGPP